MQLNATHTSNSTQLGGGGGSALCSSHIRPHIINTLCNCIIACFSTFSSHHCSLFHMRSRLSSDSSLVHPGPDLPIFRPVPIFSPLPPIQSSPGPWWCSMRQGPLVRRSPGLGLKHRPAAAGEPTIRTFLLRNLCVEKFLILAEKSFIAPLNHNQREVLYRQNGVALVMELILLSQRPLRRKILVTHRGLSSRPLSSQMY